MKNVLLFLVLVVFFCAAAPALAEDSYDLTGVETVKLGNIVNLLSGNLYVEQYNTQSGQCVGGETGYRILISMDKEDNKGQMQRTTRFVTFTEAKYKKFITSYKNLLLAVVAQEESGEQKDLILTTDEGVQVVGKVIKPGKWQVLVSFPKYSEKNHPMICELSKNKAFKFLGILAKPFPGMIKDLPKSTIKKKPVSGQ